MNLQQICSQCQYKNFLQVIQAGQELINQGFIASMYQQKIGNQLDSVLIMSGFVLVNYQQQPLQINTEVIFSKEYPISPPAFYFVNPDPNKFQVNSKYVINKRPNSESYYVILDNLNWNTHKDLKKTMNLYIQILQKDFPLYSKQFQNQNNQKNYEINNQNQIGGDIEQIIYNDNKEVEQAVNKEISSIKLQINQDINQMLDEVKQLYDHNQNLIKSSVILHRINQDLDEQIKEADSSINDMRNKCQQYSNETLKLETLKEKYMTAQSPVHNQILQLIAELDAIKETFLFTDEWFKRSKDFDQYSSQIKLLAEREFECKILLKKCLLLVN
ncbi:Vps23 core domain protein (macronuclear) [Tetrahymena thermophila SB210]|uniref:Vps23 core domain protein n=1 Tax=Tetrahymena thermophila (strain SB210) TaxID=312017 RepID=I7MGI0_TETTS|nr:Vps23 core domain protein [Tetrahymena thermophila SB210]EAR85182.4 Vps23 core domain protein [Tetrahymena thermophila SB210]|eukprot:XP_001032845.4 Vps23 core domain protein [Tetrahymena thermophila SB210]